MLETMHDAYSDRFPPLSTRRLARGEDPEVLEQRPRSVEAITEAVLEAMADEIGHMQPKASWRAADIDTCMLLGAGFPFFLGGIAKHLDQTGVSERVLGRARRGRNDAAALSR